MPGLGRSYGGVHMDDLLMRKNQWIRYRVGGFWNRCSTLMGDVGGNPNPDKLGT